MGYQPPPSFWMANASFWKSSFIGGPTCDQTVLLILRDHAVRRIPLTRRLVNEDFQIPDDAVCPHIEDMARREEKSFRYPLRRAK